MSGAKVFFDTNVLAYAQDHDVPDKRERSRQLIAEVVAAGTGVVSTQVLQEFYVTATRKMSVAPLAAKRVLQSFTIFEIVQISPALIEKAIERSVLSQLSFRDALIVSAAASSGCTTIYSEDLNAGEVIDGVRIVNPFV